MRRATALRSAAAIVVCAVLAWAPGHVGAEPPAAVLQVSAPTGASVGDTVRLMAHLSAPNGAPLAGQQLLVEEVGKFFDMSARDVTVASAATGADGAAVIRYVARREGALRLTVRFLGTTDLAGTTAPLDLTVAAGAPTYHVEPPAGIPGVNRFALIGLLACVWGTMLVVALHVAAIAREGGTR